MSKSRIKELENIILHNKKLYYNVGVDSEISDEEYDLLELELKNLDPDNPVLYMVGSNFFTGEKIKHQKKMLSLDKTYKLNDLLTWSKNREILELYKIDGTSCSLIYKEGKLVEAKTRGDGEFGERILSKVLYIKDIPKTINKTEDIEVRGEIFCRKEKFSELEKEMETRGLNKPNSIRNIVSGLLGRKEDIDLNEFLNFYSFDLIQENKNKKESDALNELNQLGFTIPPHKVYKNIDLATLEDSRKNMENFMESGDYLIDGLVFVINDTEEQEQMGYTSHHPKFKKAFKIMGNTKNTIVENINWQISRKGYYTPVAVVKPVEISGAKITNVTLHNLAHVLNNNLKIGDEIKIVRSGEVIPKFLEVVSSAKDQVVDIPKNCFYCGSELKKDDVRLFCDNHINCSGQEKEKLIHFVKTMGIDDLSEKRIQQMIDNNLVKHRVDFYKLSKEELMTLDKVKEKLASKLIKNIEASKKVRAPKFFKSLNFDGGARHKITVLEKLGYNSLEKLNKLTAQELIKIDGFQEKSANDFINSLKEEQSVILELIKEGVEIIFEEPSDKEGELNGKSFCITGTLSTKRKIIEDALKSKGAKISSSVSKNTNYLVCNDTDSSSSKMKKALELNIPVINEETLKSDFKVDY